MDGGEHTGIYMHGCTVSHADYARELFISSLPPKVRDAVRKAEREKKLKADEARWEEEDKQLSPEFRKYAKLMRSGIDNGFKKLSARKL